MANATAFPTSRRTTMAAGAAAAWFTTFGLCVPVTSSRLAPRASYVTIDTYQHIYYAGGLSGYAIPVGGTCSKSPTILQLPTSLD